VPIDPKEAEQRAARAAADDADAIRVFESIGMPKEAAIAAAKGRAA
jgi:acyl CoA:acetate/3-ketoacid CoA transferase beta subunit